MKTFALEGKLRTDLGKTASRQLRKQGLIPCVLYGNGENVNFTVTEGAIRNLIFTPYVYLVDLTIDGKEYPCVIQDLQFDPVQSDVTHIDFLVYTDTKPVTIAVPIVLKGQSIGVRAGGRLRANQRKLVVRALAKDLPDNIELDVTKLKIKDSIKVRDIKIDNLEIIAPKGMVVVSVNPARVVASDLEDEDEEGAEGEEGAEEASETSEE